jgi:hypothetical protein
MGKICVYVGIMAINLQTPDGHGIVVLPDSCVMIYKGEVYVEPRGYRGGSGSEPTYLLARDMYNAPNWPAIQLATWPFKSARQDTKQLMIVFPSNSPGVRLSFWDQTGPVRRLTTFRTDLLFLNTISLKCQTWSFRLRYIIRRDQHRMQARMLAVGMMTHARLGKACELNRFPEVVKMVMEAM